MALISCPECEKQISDKAEICIGCGFPIREYLQQQKEEEIIPEDVQDDVTCPFCGSSNIDEEGYCDDCGMKVADQKEIKKAMLEEIPPVEATGVYTICPDCGFHNEPGQYTCLKCKYKYKVGEIEIVDARIKTCPFCTSSKIRAFMDETVRIPEKTKKYTTLNLNPLKPFTVFNHKEKVVRKEITSKETKFICDNCGSIFK